MWLGNNDNFNNCVPRCGDKTADLRPPFYFAGKRCQKPWGLGVFGRRRCHCQIRLVGPVFNSCTFSTHIIDIRTWLVRLAAEKKASARACLKPPTRDVFHLAYATKSWLQVQCFLDCRTSSTSSTSCAQRGAAADVFPGMKPAGQANSQDFVLVICKSDIFVEILYSRVQEDNHHIPKHMNLRYENTTLYST